MQKLINLILILFFMIGCSTHRSYEYYEKESIHKIEMQKLPEWIYYLPAEGDYIVGISKKSFEKEKMVESAKQMAAVSKSRNKGSFAIEKYASKDSEYILKEGKVKFRLNVSSSPQEIEKIFDTLNLVDETFFFDYYIGLFSTKRNDIENVHKKKYIANQPEWFSEEKIKIEGNTIFSYSSTSSYDLIVAWEKASEQTRLEIANYLEKEVQGMVESTNENIEKIIALETAKKIENMTITRSYIISEMKNSLLSYKVFLEMKMER
ncbi:MAG TPA: hypothetical protein ENL20_07680 [Candidatus Cloacimonetes bacterium]|nr:hypothetical protein [Candidatus Cloacimonadota bacterium]